MPRGRKSFNLTAEQKLHAKRFVEKALVAGLKPDEMVEGIGKEFDAKNWSNKPSIGTIKQFIRMIRGQLEREWQEVTKNDESNRRLLHLQLESMYALAMKQGDPKVAHSVWKDIYLMVIPKKPRSSDDKTPQDRIGYDELLDEDDIENMSDEALEAAIEEGVESGEISSKVADHLIAKDQK